MRLFLILFHAVLREKTIDNKRTGVDENTMPQPYQIANFH